MRSDLGKSEKKPAGIKRQRESVFQPEFRDDLRYWVETDRKTAIRIFQLIEAIMGDPFKGIGKPEPSNFLEPVSGPGGLHRNTGWFMSSAMIESILCRHDIIIEKAFPKLISGYP